MLLAVLSGCSGDGLAYANGQILLDGQPIEQGTVRFVGVLGNAPTAEVLIVNGKYSVKTVMGPKRVEVHGYRKIGQRPWHPGDTTSPPVDILEELVPRHYNSDSTLGADLKAGKQQLDFSLKSRIR